MLLRCSRCGPTHQNPFYAQRRWVRGPSEGRKQRSGTGLQGGRCSEDGRTLTANSQGENEERNPSKNVTTAPLAQNIKGKVLHPCLKPALGERLWDTWNSPTTCKTPKQSAESRRLRRGKIGELSEHLVRQQGDRARLVLCRSSCAHPDRHTSILSHKLYLCIYIHTHKCIYCMCVFIHIHTLFFLWIFFLNVHLLPLQKPRTELPPGLCHAAALQHAALLHHSSNASP